MLENLGEYIKQAPLLAIGVSFVGGVLTSFTPCVYPVIPITIGVIGARGSTSRLHALIVSLTYVLGMALVYAVLGMIAALTGQFFGKVSVHPITNLIVGNICILFALNMFDVFYIPMPSFLSAGAMESMSPSQVSIPSVTRTMLPLFNRLKSFAASRTE